MSNFLLVRSIPLSAETANAWRTVGGKFAHRTRQGKIDPLLAGRYDYLINLGNLDLDTDGSIPVFNKPDLIRRVSAPVSLRATIGDFLPERTTVGPHWHKRAGWRGAGKVYHEEMIGECAVLGGDTQKHVVGQEFRVITVGNTVVQASKKHFINEGWPLAPIGFRYEWVGVEGIRKNGIIPLLKKAIDTIDGAENSVLGWDIIVAEKPYILECNTSMGVNEATASRIVAEIEGRLDE